MSLPIRLLANGTACLDVMIDFTWKQAPFLYCQGVLAVHGQHPDDSRNTIEIRLLGARRGPVPR